MNRLRNETSPYLQQHADNPVDWQPWDSEALQLARRLDKPILLSIGYSACHWCHVMAHESFEDPETAALMNDLFVNIKVDREERPDLDKIYQTAHQMLAQRTGGWPLTVFLTPDEQLPFFAGTYFPRQSRFGMPPFATVLSRVHEFYHQQKQDIAQQSRSLLDAMVRMDTADNSVPAELNRGPLEMARRQLQQNYDAEHGGFGKAPKFPHPGNIERLLRHYQLTRGHGEADQRARDAALFTLQRMARGGMNDQIGGGFCRYSVDDQWMIPHFEKMLYDNGQLLVQYADAAILSGDPYFTRVCTETATWVIQEMQAPDGGFYSSQDADSEGGEGRFYTWTPGEMEQALDAQQYAVVSRLWGMDRAANFEGRWHVHGYRDETSVAEELQLPVSQVQALRDQARQTLYGIRYQRVHPGLDDKILTAWNGLMIRGLARAGRLLNRDNWLDSAARALQQLQASAWSAQRLLATRHQAGARLNAYLDDYAFVLQAILEMLQARWDQAWLEFAVQLADILLEQFEDRQNGGFYFTSHDHESLFHRPRAFADDATPSGNGVATACLQQLGHLLGESRYLDAAERALRAGWSAIQNLPYAHGSMLVALEEYLQPPPLVILRGEAVDMRRWQRLCADHYVPGLCCYAIPARASDLPGLLAERRAADNLTRAYICAGSHCLPAMDNQAQFSTWLEEYANPS